MVTRVLLGLFEGCLFPSLTLFMCNWYKREELGFRIAVLFSTFSLTHEDVHTSSYLVVATALSGAFGGLLAWAMLHMNGVADMAGWRW